MTLGFVVRFGSGSVVWTLSLLGPRPSAIGATSIDTGVDS